MSQQEIYEYLEKNIGEYVDVKKLMNELDQRRTVILQDMKKLRILSDIEYIRGTKDGVLTKIRKV